MILIAGPGALGGVLAARWAALPAKGSRPVLLLGRDARQESRLVQGGLATKGLGGTSLSPGAPPGTPGAGRLLSARAAGPRPCVAAFLCVKAGDVRAAISSMRPWVGPETAVVALQNGLGHGAVLRSAFGPRRSVVGACFIAADRPRPGLVAHTGGRDVILAANGPNAKALAAARALLEQAGWRTRVAASEEDMLWTKLVFNAAVNPLGAAARATNGQLADDPVLRAILLELLAESLRVAKALGRRPLFKDMAGVLLRSSRALPAQRNSMLQDLQAGRKTEIEAIVGPILTAARRARVPAPRLEAFRRIIKRLERLLCR